MAKPQSRCRLERQPGDLRRRSRLRRGQERRVLAPATRPRSTASASRAATEFGNDWPDVRHAELRHSRAAASTSTPTRATCRSPTTCCGATAEAYGGATPRRNAVHRRQRTTTSYASPTTGSWPTAGPTWPERSPSSHGTNGYDDRPQRPLRQLLRGVRRRHQPLRAQLPSRQRDRPQPHLVQRLLRRGRRRDDRRRAADRNPTTLSRARAPVDIDDEPLQANLANDDGGGIRLLQAGDRADQRPNNIIANNVSAHEGGGIALDDATNVRLVNNTVMKNITTATAVTSDGQPPLPAVDGRATSDQLQATLPRARRASQLTRCCSTTCSGTTARARRSPSRVAGIGVMPGARRSAAGTSARRTTRPAC